MLRSSIVMQESFFWLLIVVTIAKKQAAFHTSGKDAAVHIVYDTCHKAMMHDQLLLHIDFAIFLIMYV